MIFCNRKFIIKFIEYLYDFYIIIILAFTYGIFPVEAFAFRNIKTGLGTAYQGLELAYYQ